MTWCDLWRDAGNAGGQKVFTRLMSVHYAKTLQGGCKRLVGMHESFVVDDMSCLVLSYCPGGNLQNLIEQKVFTPAAVAFYAAEAAEAIREIHRLGYVHRCVVVSRT